MQYLMGAILSALVSETEVEIQSDSECPDAQAVKARLQGLMPDARSGSVRIQRTRSGVDVLLYTAQQSGPLRRTLPPDAACEQLARLAAVVIATWQATVQQPPPPAAAPVLSPPVATKVPARWLYELSAAVLGAISGADLALAQQFDVRLSREMSSFGLRLGAHVGAPHSHSIGMEQVEWTRWSLHVRPGMLFSRDRWRIEASGAAALALIDVAGRGFQRSRRSLGLDCGLGGGLRIGRGFGRRAPSIWPFVGLDVMGWLLPQVARSTTAGTNEEAVLPQLEVLLSFGVAVADGRARRSL